MRLKLSKSESLAPIWLRPLYFSQRATDQKWNNDGCSNVRVCQMKRYGVWHFRSMPTISQKRPQVPTSTILPDFIGMHQKSVGILHENLDILKLARFISLSPRKKLMRKNTTFLQETSNGILMFRIHCFAELASPARSLETGRKMR